MALILNVYDLYIMPRMLPKGSTTEAVTNPASPRFVSGSYSFAPIAVILASIRYARGIIQKSSI